MAQGCMHYPWRLFTRHAADVPKPAAKDFLKSYQGMFKEILDDVMKIGRSSQEYLMNEKQFRFLVKRLSGTLADFPHSSHPDEKTSLVFQELRYVFEDAHRLIQSCCIKSTASNSERLRAAIEQGDLKHTFAKLLYDVRWHTYVLQSILGDSADPRITFETTKCSGDLSVNDDTALLNAKLKDDTVLTERLKSLTLDSEPERDLADQLLERRIEQAQSSEDLGHGVLRLHEDEMKKHLHGERIGKGLFGEVRALQFLGGSLAVKIIDQSASYEMEVKAMQKLGHHPNIVPLYCSSRIDEECFLIMEKMENDLASILWIKKRRRIEVSLVEKVSLMLEIAEGMRYIHRMHMAHRDLKPNNVLVNLEDPTKISSRAYSVKIADFGLTKTKEASRTYKDQTTNLGTSRYMAPEMIASGNEKDVFNPTKADVYSFGIMCSEILTGQSAFGKIENWVAFKQKVKGNGDFRPVLQQGSGPPRLESLIERCWDSNHRSRPDFKRICPELRYIKGLLLRGDHIKLQTKINFAVELGSPDMIKQGMFKEILDDVMKIGRSSQEYLMNEKQCRFLVKRLSATLADFPHSSHPDEETSLVFQELRYVFEDAHRLIQSCCIKSTASNSERLRAAIEQGDLKHTFAKLLYDVRWHADVLQSILEDSGDLRTTFAAAQCRCDLSLFDNTALMKAKLKDDTVLTERLKSLTLDSEPERDLADQLLERRIEQAQSSKDLGHGVLRLHEDEMKEHLHGERIGKGSFGEVRALQFLGGSLAVKIIDQSASYEMEVKAMQGLGHHPNIVRLYCSSRIDEECFLIMERMENDLASILRIKKRVRIKVSLVEKVSLMLEIAEGMRYIHGKHMAHRDLKPNNVLVNLEDPTKISSRAYSVKIADFGLTKTKEASRTYKDQTTNLGTSRYMAPEMIASGNEKDVFNPTKADVYSFGIMCSEILTGQSAFGKIENWVAFKQKVKGNGDFRPVLQQGSGPPRLESLIERCWDSNHRSRPDFKRICPELRYIKGLLLRGDHIKLQTKINFAVELRSPHMIKQHRDFAQATPERQGPWGRNERNKTTGLFDYMAASIKWIRVKYQQNPPGVGLREVMYVEADGQERKETYCRNVIGTNNKIKLESGEYIKQVSGCVATHPVSVVSLTIHTNLKTYGPFGDETKSVPGHRFKSGTGRVVGFFGAAGALLDKLGVWIIPDGQEGGDPSYVVDQ